MLSDPRSARVRRRQDRFPARRRVVSVVPHGVVRQHAGVAGAWREELEDGRGTLLRVSAHATEGAVVVSLWRHGRCLGTFRAAPDQVDLIARALRSATERVPPGRPSAGSTATASPAPTTHPGRSARGASTGDGPAPDDGNATVPAGATTAAGAGTAPGSQGTDGPWTGGDDGAAAASAGRRRPRTSAPGADAAPGSPSDGRAVSAARTGGPATGRLQPRQGDPGAPAEDVDGTAQVRASADTTWVLPAVGTTGPLGDAGTTPVHGDAETTQALPAVDDAP